MKFTKDCNDTEENVSPKIIRPISIKKNQNQYIEPFQNFFIDDANLPENISEEEIELLKERNKYLFFEYAKLVEKNNLLKVKLQELLAKKNEFHKYLLKLENKDKIINVNTGENFDNNNLISREPFSINNIYINRKRKRRKRKDLVYNYICNFKDCNKKYSTEGALTQHIKFKHS